MEKTTRRLIIGSLALIYISYAIYCFATSNNWLLIGFYIAALPYPLFSLYYITESVKDRKYGRTIFFIVSSVFFSIAANMIMERLYMPDSALLSVKHFFVKWFSLMFNHSASELMVMVAVGLSLGVGVGIFIRRYQLQNKQPD